MSLDRADEGIVEVRWQSRVFPCRMPDIWRAIAYLCLIASIHRREYPGDSPWQFVVEAADALKPQSSVLFGFEICNDRRWRMTTATERTPRTMHPLFFVAACNFHLRGVVAARLGHGTHEVPPGRGYEYCIGRLDGCGGDGCMYGCVGWLDGCFG